MTSIVYLEHRGGMELPFRACALSCGSMYACRGLENRKTSTRGMSR